MKLTELTLKNRTVILVLTAILVVAGTFSYSAIPKEANPSVEIPIFVINTIYPGISPSDMESLVTQPIERELQGINGVKDIRSTTTESFSNVIVEFELDVSLSEASQRVRERVDLAKNDLPPDAEDPMIIEIDIDAFPIMTINLSADYPLARLTQVSERLEDQLETVFGVREVEVLGAVEREVQVKVDLAKLNGYGLAFGQLVGAIQSQNLTIPGGLIDVGRMGYMVRVSGEFNDPSEIENLVVARPVGDEPHGPGLVYMRDVAEVTLGFRDRESYSRLRTYKVDENGSTVDLDSSDVADSQVISLNIKKRPGVNILETADAVFSAIEEFDMPAGTRVEITGDMSDQIMTLITDLENSIISGMIFVVLVLVFFLGIRNALLVGTAVPLSILVGFIVLHAFGYTVNFIILFSLIIALGLLVDNAIVVVENIYRYRELGYERFEAARDATNEVGYALIAATLTLLAAFAPMLFWPGIIGQFMSYLPLTLIIVLICSLFVALVVYPVLTGYLVKLDSDEKQPVSKFIKGVFWGSLLFLAIAVGAANMTSLVVSLLSILLVWLLYRFIIRPGSIRFSERTLPYMVRVYRNFLQWMLLRDYSAKHAMLRNTLALGALTLGALFALLGGVVLLFSPAGYILLAVGGLSVAAGFLLIVVHLAEAIFRGGIYSVRIGVALAIFVSLTLIVVSLGNRVEPQVWLVLLLLPVFLVIIGAAGKLFGSGRPLLLTDNRALLLNSVLGVLVSIIILFSVAPTGVEFFPETDPNNIIVQLEGPIGMNVHTSDAIARDVQNRIYDLMDNDESVRANVKSVQTNVGVAGDLFFGGGAQSAERSSLTLNLVDFGDRAEPSGQTMSKIREVVRDIPDVIVKIDGEQVGPPTGAPVNIEVSGENFDEIVRISREITDQLMNASVSGAVPGLVDVRNNVSGGLPEYRVLADYERASRFGLNMADIGQTIRIANTGLEASKWRDGEDEYDIVVRLRPEDRSDLESLRDLNVGTMDGYVPLTAVAEFEEGIGLGSITRLNLQRTATIEGQTSPGFSGPEVLADVQEYLAGYMETIPSGYSIEYTGENEDQEEAFGFLTTALLLGFALIFLVMLAKFNNIISPLIIMTVVGLSLIGVLLGLVLTRTSFGLMTFIGVISLAGIVCVNNVVLLDYVKQLTEAGKSKMEAIVEAGAIRFRPVLLTALTTILGLVPLTFGINIDFVNLFVNFDPDFQLGSENTAFWGPMGIAIISGLTFATFLTLVVVPVLYSAFESVARRLSVLSRPE
ncbi:MAG: efflux RND transporter permease subunit [Balneolaceae bacterium]